MAALTQFDDDKLVGTKRNKNEHKITDHQISKCLPRSRPISRPSTAAARKNIEPVKVSTFNPEHLPAPTPPRVPDVRRAISQRSSPTRLHRFSAPKGSHKTDLHVRPISKTEDHAGRSAVLEAESRPSLSFSSISERRNPRLHAGLYASKLAHRSGPERRQDALERDLREMHSAGFLSARFAYATDKPRPVPENPSVDPVPRALVHSTSLAQRQMLLTCAEVGSHPDDKSNDDGDALDRPDEPKAESRSQWL